MLYSAITYIVSVLMTERWVSVIRIIRIIRIMSYRHELNIDYDILNTIRTLNIGSINSTQEFSVHNVEHNPPQTSLSFQLPRSSALYLLPPSEQLCTQPCVSVCLCFPHLVCPPNMRLASSILMTQRIYLL